MFLILLVAWLWEKEIMGFRNKEDKQITFTFETFTFPTPS